MFDVVSLGRGAAGLAFVALRSAVATLALLLGMGMALAGISYYWLSDQSRSAGLIVAAVLLMECLVLGVVLAGKRGLAAALVQGLRTLSLGRAAVRFLFDRILGEAADANERGGWAAKAVDKLPLAQAENLVRQAVGVIVRAPATGGGVTGWLRRALQSRLLGLVEKVTLARFREEGARHGGVDLVKVRDELETQVDDRLTGVLRRGVNLWTTAVLIGLPIQAALMIALLRAYLR